MKKNYWHLKVNATVTATALYGIEEHNYGKPFVPPFGHA
jgi:hypothetical protein